MQKYETECETWECEKTGWLKYDQVKEVLLAVLSCFVVVSGYFYMLIEEWRLEGTKKCQSKPESLEKEHENSWHDYSTDLCKRSRAIAPMSSQYISPELDWIELNLGPPCASSHDSLYKLLPLLVNSPSPLTQLKLPLLTVIRHLLLTYFSLYSFQDLYYFQFWIIFLSLLGSTCFLFFHTS